MTFSGYCGISVVMLVLFIMKNAVVLLLLLTPSFSKALPPFPPQIPSYPPQRAVLPSEGYFLIGWDSMGAGGMGMPKNPNPNTVPLNARANIVKIAGRKSMGGAGATVVLNTSGAVVAMQTGMPSSTEYAVPTEASSGVVDIVASGDSCYAIKNNGKLIVWRITDNYGNSPTLPDDVSSGVVKVSGLNGDSGFVILKESGQVKCFAKDFITITNPPTGPAMPPTTSMQIIYADLPTPPEVSTGGVQIWSNESMGAAKILALKNNGQVIGWTYTGGSYSSLNLPDILGSGVAQIKSDSLFLMQDGSVVSLYYNPAGEPTVSILRGTEKDAVDVSRDTQTITTDTYILTKEGAVVGYDSSGSALILNSELTNDIKEISIWNGNNLALKNTGKVLKWSYPLTELDNSLPLFTKSQIPSLGDLGNVSYLMLSASADTAVALYCGLPLEVLVQLVSDRIKKQPQNYGLATQSGLSTAIQTLATKSELSPLATKAELTSSLSQSRTDGINSVLSNPNLWTLYTTNQIKNMAIGDLVLTRTNNGQFVLNYDIEQSEDLANWTPYAGFAMVLTNLPTDKAFVRIKAKQ